LQFVIVAQSVLAVISHRLIVIAEAEAGFEHVVQFVIVAQSVLAIISHRLIVIAEAEAGTERCAGQQSPQGQTSPEG